MRTISIARTPIGIDVGSRGVKAVQIRTLRGRRQIAAMAVLPRLTPGRQIDPEETAKLRQTLARQGFSGNRIVLAAPDNKLLRGIFELPRQVSGDALTQIARMEMARTHNIAPDSFEMTCWSAANESPDKAKPTTATMAVGCPHEVADSVLDAFELSGFNVQALDTTSSAAIRACSPLILTPPATTCILDLGWGSTKLLLVCGRTVVYERVLDEVCISKLIAKFAAKSGVNEQWAWQVIAAVGFSAGSPQSDFGQPQLAELDQQSMGAINRILAGHFDTLLEDLKAPFAYISHQYGSEGIRRMLLIGGGAAVSGLPQHLQAATGIEALPAAPYDVLKVPGTHGGNPAATVALGLAQFTARLSPARPAGESPKSGA